jgi:hypothetical protein
MECAEPEQRMEVIAKCKLLANYLNTACLLSHKYLTLHMMTHVGTQHI